MILLAILGSLALVGLFVALVAWDQRQFQRWGDDRFGKDSGWGDGP